MVNADCERLETDEESEEYRVKPGERVGDSLPELDWRPAGTNEDSGGPRMTAGRTPTTEPCYSCERG